MKRFFYPVLLLSVLTMFSCKKEDVSVRPDMENVNANIRTSEELDLEITPYVGSMIYLTASKVSITKATGETIFTVTVEPGTEHAQVYYSVSSLSATQVSDKLRLIKNFGLQNQVTYENKSSAIVTATSNELSATINGPITIGAVSIIIEEIGGI